MKERKYTVYIHTCNENGKKYVGVTCQRINRRWGKNGAGYKLCTYFGSAINKYGWDNFNHEIVLCNLTKDEAEMFEIEIIKYYKTIYLYSKGILDDSDIKYKISESVMKNKDDLYFYSSVLELPIKQGIEDVYSITYINKNKKLKYILDKCGYKIETSKNYNTPGVRNYVIDENVKEFNGYVI